MLTFDSSMIEQVVRDHPEATEELILSLGYEVPGHISERVAALLQLQDMYPDTVIPALDALLPVAYPLPYDPQPTESPKRHHRCGGGCHDCAAKARYTGNEAEAASNPEVQEQKPPEIKTENTPGTGPKQTGKFKKHFHMAVGVAVILLVGLLVSIAQPKAIVYAGT